MKARYVFPLCLFSAFILSCGNQAEDKNKDNSDSTATAGNMGNNFYLNEIDHYLTLYPHSITDLVSANIAYQIYEGLVAFNPKDLSIVPSIAEKWEIDPSGKKYTFHLKKGVKFQDDPCFEGGKGREVKASDFLYSFELLCTQSPDNRTFSSSFKDRVAGANEYYSASAKGKPSKPLEGVKVIDDQTLEITLVSPDQSFLNILATIYGSVLAKEAVEKYGNATKIGTGPFILKEPANAAEKVYLVKNPNYHKTDKDGKRLPYIDTLVVSFLPTKQAEVEQFKKEKLDLVWGLPTESISELMQAQIKDFKNKPPKYLLERSPDMASNYYEFNLNVKPYDNVKVRQALNYAIDRELIVKQVLNDQAYGPAIYGITPPAFKNYGTTTLKGYTYDVQKAKKLLAEAGFPDGKGLPVIKLQFNGNNTRNTSVAIEIQKQLFNNLNVNIDLANVSFAAKQENAMMGKTDVVKTTWIADYPSPENFLNNFYGKTVPASPTEVSYPNTTRYKSAEFDRLFEMGRMAKTIEEANKYFLQAEQVMINDAPIIPLWYDENYRLLNTRVKNFFFNPMNYRSFTEVQLGPYPTEPLK